MGRLRLREGFNNAQRYTTPFTAQPREAASGSVLPVGDTSAKLLFMPGQIAQRLLAVFATVAIALSAAAEPESVSESVEQVIRRLQAMGFELERTTVGDMTLYLDRSLEAQRKNFVEAFQTLNRSGEQHRDRRAHLLQHQDRIAKRIQQLVGGRTSWPNDKPSLTLQTLLAIAETAEWWLKPDATFIVLNYHEIKNQLRAGRSIPFFSYDRDKNGASFLLSLGGSSHQGEIRPITPQAFLVWPADPTGLDRGPRYDQLGAQLESQLLGGIIHEATEITVAAQCRSGFDYPRWYGDGLAEALTEVILAEEFDQVTADTYRRDTEPYESLRDQINLRYWCQAGTELSLPFESEQAIEQARYIFAAHEMRRLIKVHGIDAIAAINNRATQEAPPGTDEIIAAIREVTGEDMAARLRRYQRFDTAEEGFNLYNTLNEEAQQRQDYRASLIASTRIMELRQMRIEVAKVPPIAAMCVKTGIPETGRDFIAWWIQYADENSDKPDAAEAKAILNYAMVRYAIMAQHPEWGHDSADFVLTDATDNPLAMLVRAHRLAGEGQLEQARSDAIEASKSLDMDEPPVRVLVRQILDEQPTR